MSYINAGAAIKVAYYTFIFALFTVITILNAPNSHSLRRVHFSWWGIGMLFFVTIYMIRILYDLYIANVLFMMTANKATIPFLFFCGAIMPLFLMPMLDFTNINWSLFTKVCYAMFVGMGLYSLYLNLSGLLLDSIFTDGRMRGNESMDTIGFGHLGVTIVLASIAVMHDSNWIWKIIGTSTIIMGLGILLGAGSRGPMVALGVCVLSYLYARGHRTMALLSIPVILLVFYLAFPLLNAFFVDQGNYAIERIYNSIFHANELSDPTSARDALYAEMLDSLFESPILGASFLLKDGVYVHNIIFESFLATGFIGGLIFLVLIMTCFVQAIRAIGINTNYIFIGLLFIQYFMYGVFSRSLAILPIFWFSMYSVIGLGQTYYPIREIKIFNSVQQI